MQPAHTQVQIFLLVALCTACKSQLFKLPSHDNHLCCLLYFPFFVKFFLFVLQLGATLLSAHQMALRACNARTGAVEKNVCVCVRARVALLLLLLLLLAIAAVSVLRTLTSEQTDRTHLKEVANFCFSLQIEHINEFDPKV